MSSEFISLLGTVHSELGIPGDTPSSVVNQSGIIGDLVRWVADADYEIQSMWADWDFLWAQWTESALPSISDYVRPLDWGEWDMDSFYLNFSLNNNTKLVPIPYREYRAGLRQGVQTENRPSRVVVLPNNNVRLHPVPDDTYTITADYWMQATRMTVNDSVSPIPTAFERIIIERAKMKYAENQGVPEVMNSASLMFENWMDQLTSHQLPGQRERRMGTTDRPLDMVVKVV